MSLFPNRKGEETLRRLNYLNQWRAFARISNNLLHSGTVKKCLKSKICLYSVCATKSAYNIMYGTLNNESFLIKLLDSFL